MCIRSRNEWCVTARSSTCSVSSLKEVDCKGLYRIAQKQALLGVLFYGIRQLPKELAPEQKLLMQWMAMAEQIRKRR